MHAPAPMRVMARRLASDPVVRSLGSFSGAFIATPFAVGHTDGLLGESISPWISCLLLLAGRPLPRGWRALAWLGSAGSGDLHHRPVDTAMTGRWMPIASWWSTVGPTPASGRLPGR